MTKHEWEKLREGASPQTRRTMEAVLSSAKVIGLPDEKAHNVSAEMSGAKPGIRVPKARKMNHAESLYLRFLQDEFPGCRIEYEAWVIRLKSGARYTADFTVWHPETPRLILVVEVKGRPAKNHSKARSILAFKTAASEWPIVLFRFAQKEVDGSWSITEINR